nr:glutathione s-transferase 3 [Quercus suber]
MGLTVHHLQVSQSERIVWLCEALGIEYELKLYQRDPLLSPAEYTALHPIGAAPVITDGKITLAESEACMEYIINVHGDGRLAVKPGESNYADCLYWYHFINGTLQPALGRVMALRSCQVPDSNPIRTRYEAKVKQCFEFIDKRLGEVPYLAGPELTKADIMAMFSLSCVRKFFAVDETPYQNVQAYLQRVAKIESYQRAMKKGDPDLDISELISAKGPELFGPLKNLAPPSATVPSHEVMAGAHWACHFNQASPTPTLKKRDASKAVGDLTKTPMVMATTPWVFTSNHIRPAISQSKLLRVISHCRYQVLPHFILAGVAYASYARTLDPLSSARSIESSRDTRRGRTETDHDDERQQVCRLKCRYPMSQARLMAKHFVSELQETLYR